MTTTTARPVPHFTTASRLVTTALAAALLLAPSAVMTARADAAPARAGGASAPAPHRVVSNDAVGDVGAWLIKDTFDDATPAPQDRSTDIVQTVVDHRAYRLSVDVAMRQVERSGYRSLFVLVKTSRGKEYNVMADYSRPHGGKRVDIVGPGGRSVTCRNVRWSADSAAAELHLSVPRSCLGNPDSVRVAVTSSWISPGFKRVHFDDSRIDGTLEDGFVFDQRSLGPRQPHA